MGGALRRAGVGLKQGGVYKVKDSSVIFKDEPGAVRTQHWERWIVVLSNDRVCASDKSPVILIAPFSSDTDITCESDIDFPKTATNGLTQRCRLAMSHIQPLLKDEIEAKVGELSEPELTKVKGNIVWICDLDDDE
jgi:mRNA-degrading endonuclease toxin of MazEF toxin-antitoxin module